MIGISMRKASHISNCQFHNFAVFFEEFGMGLELSALSECCDVRSPAIGTVIMDFSGSLSLRQPFHIVCVSNMLTSGVMIDQNCL